MPVSQHLEEEGIVIPPTLLFSSGQLQQSCLDFLQMPAGALEDLAAQVGANHLGVQRFCELVDELSSASFNAGMRELDAYADRIMAKLIGALTPVITALKIFSTTTVSAIQPFRFL